MKTMKLLEELEFDTKDAHAQPLFVDRNGRVIRFTLKPGQSLKEHTSPNSPFYVVVLKGNGIFASREGKEQPVGPNSLLIFDPKETHTVRALDEELVFIGFLRGEPSNVSMRTGGKLGQKRK